MENEITNQPLSEDMEVEIVQSSENELEIKSIDYSEFSRNDFVALLKDLIKENNIRYVDNVSKEIKPLYDRLRETERKLALEKYLKEGGVKEDFEFRNDEVDHNFEDTLKLVREKCRTYFKAQKEKKEENLRKKNQILEKLRILIDGEESPDTFHQFKELQHEWKETGPVPVGQLKILWANYSALVNRFYDRRNIYFELKDLDRKRNLNAKKELLARAERLSEMNTSVLNTVRDLNELHHEFRHIGPVPKEEQEALWQKFKSISDTIYARRDAYVTHIKSELQANLEKKEQLKEEILSYTTFASDQLKEWNQKTKAVLELQKRWEEIGNVPRLKQGDLNKQFWNSFKKFFHNKTAFFKKLDEERQKNLQLKEALLARAIELKTSEDYQKASDEYKSLQAQWKQIGPVPEKFRNKIYEQFREVCNAFFDQRRAAAEKLNQEHEKILEQKESIIAQLAQLSIDHSGSLDQIRELKDKFNQLGFVPQRAVTYTKSKFNDALRKAILAIQNISDKEKEQAILEIELSEFKNDPQAKRKLIQKEQYIRKQLARVENEIGVLQNNLVFFGRSKNVHQLKEEYGKKIKDAEREISELKGQLKKLKQAFFLQN